MYHYVTQFVILESNSTFAGLPKPLVFYEKAYQRVALDPLLRIAVITDDDLLIMFDVDEIPSRHTVNLLRWCDEIPKILHLPLKNYLYSFEFLLDKKSWRAFVHSYQTDKMRYAHDRQSDGIATFVSDISVSLSSR